MIFSTSCVIIDELVEDETEVAETVDTGAEVIVVEESQFCAEVVMTEAEVVGTASLADDGGAAVEFAEEELALATTAEYCCISMTAASSNT